MDKKENSLKEMAKKKITLKEIGIPKLVLIFVIGVLMIIIVPMFNSSNPGPVDNKIQEGNEIPQNGTNTTSHDLNNYITNMEKKLENILRKVSGIGDVEVMITLKSSKEQITLKDTPYTQESLNEEDGEGGSRTNTSIQREESTVLVTKDNGNTEPYIIQEREPEVEGILVVAEGGDDVRIIRDVMETAEALFDVPIHKVKVMKMSDGIK